MQTVFTRYARVVGFAALGGVGGFASTAARTQACDCDDLVWRLELREATSTDVTQTHRLLWPEAAYLITAPNDLHTIRHFSLGSGNSTDGTRRLWVGP
jgi:hypothetical protein